MTAAASPLAWLAARGAHRDVLDGLRHLDGDWRDLWERCPRGDWLLGIAARLEVDHAALVRAAIACVRLAAGDGDENGVLAAAENWTRGQATARDVAAATERLESALDRLREPTRSAFAQAILAVGLGVVDRDVVSGAPAAIATARMMGAAPSELGTVMLSIHRQCADAVRSAVTWEAFARALPPASG